MAETTGIEWCDATWNPWTGCTKVSPGCENCYMYRGKGRWKQDPTKVVRSAAKTFNLPLAKNADGSPKIASGKSVFVCSWSDFFHEAADDWREDALEIMGERPDLTFLLLTKRPERFEHCLAYHRWTTEVPSIDLEHIWLGVTAENQEQWNKRVGELMCIDWPGKRFVSCEPLLSEIDADFCDAGQAIGPCDQCGHSGSNPDCEACAGLASIDWLICGGESGPNHREIKLDWVRGLRDQCVGAGVPFFLKQYSGVRPAHMPELDGKVWDERPEAACP